MEEPHNRKLQILSIKFQRGWLFKLGNNALALGKVYEVKVGGLVDLYSLISIEVLWAMIAIFGIWNLRFGT